MFQRFAHAVEYNAVGQLYNAKSLGQVDIAFADSDADLHWSNLSLAQFLLTIAALRRLLTLYTTPSTPGSSSFPALPFFGAETYSSTRTGSPGRNVCGGKAWVVWYARGR